MGIDHATGSEHPQNACPESVLRLQYRADLMPQGNRECLEMLRDFGFEWADCAAGSWNDDSR